MFKNFIQNHKARFSDEHGYTEYKTEDMQEAFNAGRAAGVAWAERFTAEQCCQLVADKLYNGWMIGAAAVIKEKFGLEI